MGSTDKTSKLPRLENNMNTINIIIIILFKFKTKINWTTGIYVVLNLYPSRLLYKYRIPHSVRVNIVFMSNSFLSSQLRRISNNSNRPLFTSVKLQNGWCFSCEIKWFRNNFLIYLLLSQKDDKSVLKVRYFY